MHCIEMQRKCFTQCDFGSPRGKTTLQHLNGGTLKGPSALGWSRAGDQATLNASKTCAWKEWAQRANTKCIKISNRAIFLYIYTIYFLMRLMFPFFSYSISGYKTFSVLDFDAFSVFIITFSVGPENMHLVSGLKICI